MKKLMAVLVCLAIVAQLMCFAVAEEECDHVSKHRIVEVLWKNPIYLMDGVDDPMTYHRVLYEAWEYWECDRCGERFSGKPSPDDDVIEVEPHEPVTDGEVPATCSNEGYTGNTYCVLCGRNLKTNELVPKKSHTIEIIKGTQATCFTSGLTDGQRCTECGEVLVKQEYIFPQHTRVVIPAVPATETADGWTAGERCSVCGEILKKQEVVPAHKHNAVAVPAVAATCSVPGLTAGEKCSICGLVLKAQDYTPTIAHTPVAIPEVPATCTQQGMSAGQKCSVCGLILTAPTSIDMIPHTPVEIPAVEATCTATGLTAGEKCSVCGEILKAQETVQMKDHTPVVDPAKEPTYTETGLTEGTHCSVCGTVLQEQQEIPMLIQAQKVTLNRGGTISLVQGRRLSLSASVKPANAKTELTWKSSKPGVAKVSSSGVVTAVKKGNTTITVKTSNGLSDSVNIKVIAPLPTSVSISQGSKATLYMGSTLKLSAKLSPLDAESDLTWTSSKSTVATVSGSGVVTPKKAGVTVIKVKSANGKSASISVTVVDVTKVTIKEGKTATLKVGKKLILNATTTPAKVKTTLTWTSSNRKVATVSSEGVVKALKPGKAKITVKASNGKKATIVITVE